MMTHGRSTALLLALLLTALVGLGADGCGMGDSLSATLFTPSSPAKGTVTVSFELKDSSGKPASVSLDFSTDGGLTYAAAATSGSTSGLATGTGATHTLGWDSLADLGSTKATVILRIKPSNAEGAGSSSTSGGISVDNTSGSNLPPTVTITDPKGESHPDAILPSETFHGHLLISFTLADAEGDLCGVAADYSIDGGVSFAPATSADGASLSGLDAPAAGKAHAFLWDSKADLGAVKAEVIVRLTASDSKMGSPARTGYLPLHNIALEAERGPYLQNVTPTGIVVVWKTGQRTTTMLEFDSADGASGDVVTTPGMSTLHVVELTGLTPGAYYSYKASASGVLVGSSKFRTTPGPGAPFTFVSFGDSGVGLSGLEIFVQEDLAKLMVGLEPDLMVHTGDVVYPKGEQKDYTAKYFTPYKALGARTVAYPSLGNHDMKAADGAAYLENFYLPKNNPKKNERYYSFDYGDVHFVALDSVAELGPETEQGKWLDADLAKTTQAWKVVYFHHAVYSSGRHGSSVSRRADLEPTLIKHGVDLVLNGHDHHYERTKPMDGVVYIVTGGGGAPLYPYDAPSSFTHFGISEWHFVHVTASASKLDVKAISVTGKTIDSFTLSK